jgi:hypothetical protein
MKKINKEKIVYVVHCIDTEGPLNESLKATFERLKHIYHLNFKPSKITLKKLQKGQLDLKGLEDSVKQTLNPEILNYNNSWNKINKMLKKCMSKKFRNFFPDSKGKGWIFNWHCVDHIDFEKNPRKRVIGFHKIFDRYRGFIKRYKSNNDGFYFHYHPHPIQKFAHLCATRWLGPTDKIFQILSRRILDRYWFPAVNRPGFQVCRPDSHWFLEQFIPFDYANLAIDKEKNSAKQFDVSEGRSGDWRRAPKTWVPYHPSHDDYQIKGNCNRWIARCLNIGTRFDNLNQKEVDKAFKEANNGKPVILSFANHDFRDIKKDIYQVYRMLKKSKNKFKKVKFLYANGINAMRHSLKIKNKTKFKIGLKLKKINSNAHILEINTSDETFGPQPYFTFKTKKGEYHYDNLDFQVPKRKWTYTFDEETLPLKEILTIGVASNSKNGSTSISILNPKNKKQKNIFLN